MNQLRPTRPGPEGIRPGFVPPEGPSAWPDGETPRHDQVRLDGELFFRIADSHALPEFFMSLASAGNHWMFVSSRGALTAGRRDANQALFPYCSADKLSDQRLHAGPVTLIRLRDGKHAGRIWQPFAGSRAGREPVRQAVCKSELGSKLWLEEVHEELGLLFRYRWAFGLRCGFVRTCELLALGERPVEVDLLDGLLNLMPAGLDRNFQLRFSNLADAYKLAECLPPSGPGLFYLSSIPTDRPEPAEGLRATMVWQVGLGQPQIGLHEGAIEGFLRAGTLAGESSVRGRRGAFLAACRIKAPPAAVHHQGLACEGGGRWSLVAETGCEPADVAAVRLLLEESPERVVSELAVDIADNEQRLLALISSADGRQAGNDRLKTQRHQTNALFNIMRGGLPVDSYRIRREALLRHVAAANRHVAARHRHRLAELPPVIERTALLESLGQTGDPDLVRAGREFLPFCFGRRHGDPTRPWNEFLIDVGPPDGAMEINYQGNWRDLFQNWEALAHSWPAFCEAMIFRFVNASTADGHNPYRLSQAGIDWEVPDPDDPWAGIGYWGDHQVIYLSKLVEAAMRFDPGGLQAVLDARECVFADVPYRIGDHARIRINPRATVDFDHEHARRIADRVAEVGADGKLLHDAAGAISRVSLLEKLLVPVLARMTSYVPDGGIWLTTQRPEWNDANNGLAGYGLSVVTVCYLHRYLGVLRQLLAAAPLAECAISDEVAGLMESVVAILGQVDLPASGLMDPQERRKVVDALGTAGSTWRAGLYANGLSGRTQPVPIARVVELIDGLRRHTLQTIRNNRRSDGLYHAYNLIDYEVDGHADRLRRLDLMLEGQVAVLSAGILDGKEVLELLTALRGSPLFRADQQSYLLYPDRELPAFLEKSLLPGKAVQESALLQRLERDRDHSVFRRGIDGSCHFAGDLRHGGDLRAALDRLRQLPEYRELVDREAGQIEALYEQAFRHHEFTGRSGRFFAYEGLGSVYWHMVSKLILAIQENLLGLYRGNARNGGSASASGSRGETATVAGIRRHYEEAWRGLGLGKTPAEHGAFPTDPYSHTPRHAGAQQPGMTGQVKEDILIRWGELGLQFEKGRLQFEPVLFDRRELLTAPAALEYFDLRQQLVSLPLQPGSFGFTCCQVPVVYRLDGQPGVTVFFRDGTCSRRRETALSADESRWLTSRADRIDRIEVGIADWILPDDAAPEN